MKNGDELSSQGGASSPVKTTSSHSPSNQAPSPPGVPITPPKPQGVLLKKRPTTPASLPSKARGDNLGTSQTMGVSPEAPKVATKSETTEPTPPLSVPTKAKPAAVRATEPPREQSFMASKPTGLTTAVQATDLSQQRSSTASKPTKNLSVAPTDDPLIPTDSAPKKPIAATSGAPTETSPRLNHFSGRTKVTRSTGSSSTGDEAHATSQPLLSRSPRKASSPQQPLRDSLGSAPQQPLRDSLASAPQKPLRDSLASAPQQAHRNSAAPAKTFNPIAHYEELYNLLVDAMQSFVDKPDPYTKAIAGIKAILDEQYYSQLNTPELTLLRQYLPQLKQKPAPHSDHHSSIDSDTQSQNKPSTQGSSAGNSVPSSSPDNDKDVPLIAPPANSPDKRSSTELDSSPEPLKIATRADDNHTDSSPRSDNDSIVYPEQNSSQCPFVPVSDLFSEKTKIAIQQEESLSDNHPLLKPLTLIINTLKNLKGDLQEQKRLLTAVTDLCQYYSDVREQLVQAKNPEQRFNLLRSEASAVSNCLDYFILDKGSEKSSTAKGLDILCCDETGKTRKTNEFGNRAGKVHNGKIYAKKDPPHGPHLKPAAEMGVGAFIQLFDQKRMNAAPSAILKVLHTEITPAAEPSDDVEAMTHFYNNKPNIERLVQCGYLIDEGFDFQLVLESLGVFYCWRNGLKDGLASTLSEFEALIKQNPAVLDDTTLWPPALIQHSGRKGAELQRLPKYFKIMRTLIADYSPARAVQELPQVLRRLNSYHFSALFTAILPTDPNDLSASNLKFVWRTFPDGTRDYAFVCIDSDESFDFSVLLNAEGLHDPNIKCILSLLKEQLNQPIDPEFREEFLSRSPLVWMVDWFQIILSQDKQLRQLIAEQAITEGDLAKDPLAEIPQEPAKIDTALPSVNEATTRRQVIPEKASSVTDSLKVLLNVHPELFFSMLSTLERMHQAIKSKSALTLLELHRVAKPESALHIETFGFPQLSEKNPADSLMTAFIQTAFKAPTYEETFLKDKLIPLLQERLGNKFQPSFMNPLVKYLKLLEEQKLNVEKAAASKSKSSASPLLPTIEELAKQCPLPDYCGAPTLFDLLSKHSHIKDEYLKRATLSVVEGVKLLIKNIDFNQYIPKRIPELLALFDQMGSHPAFFQKDKSGKLAPFIQITHLSQEQLDELVYRAAEAALPGAVTLLAQNFADLSKLHPSKETPLHALMRTHHQHAADKVIATVQACLKSRTTDAELLDAHQRTPLMAFIEGLDQKNAAFAADIITLFKESNINLNQRTPFLRRDKSSVKGPGTALDFAIDANNPAAFMALIQHGASDLVDTEAAIRFVLHHRGNQSFDAAVELLKVLHPRFAYDMAIQTMTTTQPDREHPESCMLRGARHQKRYLLKGVWDKLFDKKSEINNTNSVADGAHVVIPMAMQEKENPLLFCKFYPEFPGLQRLVEVLLECLGCACTYSELWRVDCADGKKAFPFLLSTAIEGESLFDVLMDPAKRAELDKELDREHFTLLSTIFLLVGQEDGHAKQYKVVRMPMDSPGKRLRIVPVDFDRAFVAAFLHDGKEKIQILKDIILLMPQFLKSALSPQAIATIICANGKRLPTKGLSAAQAETLIRENAAALFDHFTTEGLKTEDQHMRLFPRDDALSKTCTKTSAEMIEENAQKPFVSNFGNALDRFESAEQQQANKTKTVDEKKKGQSFLVRTTEKMKEKLGINHNFTVLGCPVEPRRPAVDHERYIQIARILHSRSGAPLPGGKLFGLTRADLYPTYNGVVSASPLDNPCQHYAIMTKGVAKQKSAADPVPRTLSRQYDAFAFISQPLTTKFRAEQSSAPFSAAAQFYQESKRRATNKAIAVHNISAGDTTALQACKSEWEKEDYVKSLRWVAGGRDNRAVLSTILSEEIHFSELRLINCKDLIWNDLKILLQFSPTLETLNLSGCSGLKKGVTNNNLFQLLADYCPMVKTVIISNTEISSLEFNGSDLPSLTTVIARDCLLLESASITNSGLEELDLKGCENLKSLAFEYTAKEALRRPLNEERPLQRLNVEQCKKLKGDDITAVLERAPFLRELRHQNNLPFNARSFVWFALEQRRFNREIFYGMIQNGVLNFRGLHVTEQLLKLMRQWSTHDDAPKITEVIFRGDRDLPRMAVLEFVVKVQTIIRVVYPGPFLGIRSCGSIHYWDIGLNDIKTVKSLSNGAIIAFSQRGPVKSMKRGAVQYNIRMADDKGKNHLDRAQYFKEIKEKWTQKPYTLIEGADLLSCSEMPDGSLLLSMQEDLSIPHASSYLLTLDLITHEKCALDVPEISALGGSLCVINDKTIALHSDRFYLIHKTEIGWRIRHSAAGLDGGCPPVSNGQDLVSYCVAEGALRKLCIMNIHTGELLSELVYKDTPIKPLRFIDPERLVIYDGRYYTVLSMNVMEMQTIEPYKHPKFKDPEENCNITDPRFAWVTVLPTHELLLGGGQHTETLDLETLSRITHLGYGKQISDFIITHLGDGLLLDDNGQLFRDAKRFFVLDLSFRQRNQKGFDCLPQDPLSTRLQIISPEPIRANPLNIDNCTLDSWPVTMLSGEPTSTTFYDMLFAFFEKYDAYKDDEGQKPFVTFEDKTIRIEGLSERERSKLVSLLDIFWQRTPSLASTHKALSFHEQPRTVQSTQPNTNRSNPDVDIADFSEEEVDTLKF